MKFLRFSPTFWGREDDFIFSFFWVGDTGVNYVVVTEHEVPLHSARGREKMGGKASSERRIMIQKINYGSLGRD